MLGQKELLRQFNTFTIDTLPQAILLLGDRGCGKHLLVNELANRLNLPIVEIDPSISSEELLNYNYCPFKKIYTLDITNLIEKDQNKFLKFVEEPSPTVSIILTSEREAGILSTIVNRCKIYRFVPYTEAELRQIYDFDNSEIYKVCRTPGQLQLIDAERFPELLKICRVIAVGTAANYANFMKVALKINYKEEYNKFDFDLFFDTLKYAAFDEYLKTNNKKSLLIYNFTATYYQRVSLVRSFSKDPFMYNFLTELWEMIQ